MNGLIGLAVTSYKQLWSDEQKRQAESFFNTLDCNGDKKVSFNDLRDKQIISNDLLLVFTKLDSDGDGALDFEEVLSLYFYKYMAAEDVMAYKPSARFCKGVCGRLQNAPDYSCFKCLKKEWRRSYHLCSACYAKGVHLKHKHPEWYMLKREALDVLDNMKHLLFEDDKRKDESKNGRPSSGARDALILAANINTCTIM